MNGAPSRKIEVITNHWKGGQDTYLERERKTKNDASFPFPDEMKECSLTEEAWILEQGNQAHKAKSASNHECQATVILTIISSSNSERYQYCDVLFIYIYICFCLSVLFWRSPNAIISYTVKQGYLPIL